MVVVTADAEARDVLASRMRPTNVVWNFILILFVDRFKRRKCINAWNEYQCERVGTDVFNIFVDPLSEREHRP